MIRTLCRAHNRVRRRNGVRNSRATSRRKCPPDRCCHTSRHSEDGMPAPHPIKRTMAVGTKTQIDEQAIVTATRHVERGLPAIDQWLAGNNSCNFPTDDRDGSVSEPSRISKITRPSLHDQTRRAGVKRECSCKYSAIHQAPGECSTRATARSVGPRRHRHQRPWRTSEKRAAVRQ